MKRLCHHLRSLMVVSLTIRAACVLSAEHSEPRLDSTMTACGFAPVSLFWGLQNHQFAVIRIDGSPATAMVDTGAAEILVDRTRASGLARLRTLSVIAQAASPDHPHVLLPSLGIGPVTFTNEEASVYELHRDLKLAVGSRIPYPATGELKEAVVPMRILVRSHAWIDCSTPRLYVRPEAIDAASQLGLENSLEKQGFRPLDVVRLSDHARLLSRARINAADAGFIVDTGSLATIFDRLQLENFHLRDRQKLVDLQDLEGIKSELRFTYVESFQLGTFTLTNFPIGVNDLSRIQIEIAALPDYHGPPLVGFLGPEILDRAGAVIDCETGKIWISPRKPAAN